jgi:hypothetical protein
MITYFSTLVLLLFFVVTAHHFTTRYYAEYYSEKQEQIFVTLTTSPQRIAHIAPTIDSIMQQSVKPDKIMLNLPHVFKRNNTRFTTLPTFLTDNPYVQINWCEDMGPATKLLGALPAVHNPDAMMIVIDDDIAFYPDFIAKFMRYARTFSEAALTGSPLRMGVPMQSRQFFTPSRDPTLPVISSEFVEGYTGIVVRRKFMDEFDYSDVFNSPPSCYRGDDFVFSNHLRKRNIPILALPDIVSTIRILDLGLHGDALHLGAGGESHGHDYDDCATYFRNKNDLYLTHFAPCSPQCKYDIQPMD